MTITPVSGQVVSAAFGTINHGTLTLPNAPTPGNTIIACLQIGNGAGTLSANDGAGHTYTLTPASPVFANGMGVAIFYLDNLPAGTSKNFIWSSSVSVDTNGWIAEFPGIVTASPIDVEAKHTTTTSGTAINDPTIVTTIDGDLLIGVVAAGQTVTAVGNPWTQLGSVENGNAVAYMTQSAHGSQALALTQSPAGSWTALVSAFKASATPPPPPPPPTFALQPYVFDNGLSGMAAACDTIVIISGAVASYADVTAMKLGSSSLGAGKMFGSPSTPSSGGRQISSVAISNGSVTASGTAAGWAAVDAASSILLACGPLASNVTVMAGDTFSLGSFTLSLVSGAAPTAPTLTDTPAGGGGGGGGTYDDVNHFPQVTSSTTAGYRPTLSGSTLTFMGPGLSGGASTTTDQLLSVALSASGAVTSSAAGQVIQGLNISGDVQINHSNVTLRQCHVAGSVYVTGGIGGVLVEDCEIDAGGPGNTAVWPGHPTNTLLTGTGLTVRRCSIHNAGDGVSISQGPMTFVDNIIWGLTDGGNPSANHVNGIQHNGGNLGQITIQHSTIQNALGQTDCIMLDDYYGQVANVTVTNNLLQGGGDYCIYLDCRFNNTTPSNVVVTNNAMQKTSPFVANDYHFFSVYPNTYSGNYDYISNAAIP